MKKYRCIKKTNINFINVGDFIYAVKRYENYNLYDCDVKIYYYLYCDGNCIGKMIKSDFLNYFEEYIEEQEECTVTTEPTKEIFKGWDIIRLITEGKLKEGTRLYDNTTTCSCTYKYGCLIDECEEEVDMEYIIHGEFEIDEPVELVTFKEALNKKLKIRHKDWDSSISFTTPQNALSFMARYKEEEIDNMLYEDRCWEVESND